MLSTLPPLTARRSILFFLIPAVFMNLIFWKVLPVADLLVKPLLKNFFFGFGLPAAILLLAAIRFARKEGNIPLAERFRLNVWNRRVALWCVWLSLFLIVMNRLLSGPALWLQENVIPPPKFWMRIVDVDPNYFMEVPMHGNVWLPVSLALFILFHIFCQEVWWRGYVLPRQELHSGRLAWLIHGLLWSLFEAYMVWNLPRNFIAGLAMPFVCQRTTSTWPSVIARFAIHIPLLTQIIQGV